MSKGLIGDLNCRVAKVLRVWEGSNLSNIRCAVDTEIARWRRDALKEASRIGRRARRNRRILQITKWAPAFAELRQDIEDEIRGDCLTISFLLQHYKGQDTLICPAPKFEDYVN